MRHYDAAMQAAGAPTVENELKIQQQTQWLAEEDTKPASEPVKELIKSW